MSSQDRVDGDTETAPLLREEEEGHGNGFPAKSERGATSWSYELRLVAGYSIPLIATYLLQYSFSVITTFVAGHLSADDLAAASIGLTTINIMGFAVMEGMATALDTLCAQAYGSGDINKVGLYVQRMLLLMALTCVPLGVLCYFSPYILIHLVRQRHLAIKAGSFLRMSLIGLPGYGAFEAGKRFLQAQGDFRTGMVILIVCAPINAFLSWLLTFKLGMGLDGASLAVALSNDLRPVLLLLYTRYGRKSAHKCWGGFSRLALKGWGPMLRLSLSGVAVTLAEWAAFELVTFSTSYLSTQHLAVQTICTTMAVLIWHIPFSVSVAVSTRIGHLIGAGDLKSARRAAILYAILFVVIGLADGLLFVILRHHIGAFFSVDKAIQDMVAQTIIVVALYQLGDSILCASNGLLRGLGRQHVAAWTALGANYLIGVPLAIWLELGPWHWGLHGVWLGLGMGLWVSGIIEVLYIKLIDWNRCVESVRLRGDI
jgi:multidrug resistance protein, MATE family